MPRRVTIKSLARWENAVAISGTNIDWSPADHYYETLTGNKVYTFSNVGEGMEMTIDLTQGASPYTVTWPTVVWTGGVTPDMVTDAGVNMTFHFHKQNGIIYGEAGAVSGDEADLAFIGMSRYLTNN